MNVAHETATLSHATRLKVGAVAVRDRRIVCCGYNGTAPKRPNSCEDNQNGVLVTKDEVIHAECNLICYSAKNGISLENCSLYISHMPCIRCSIMISAAGFSSVYYDHPYRDDSGVRYLEESGIVVKNLQKQK